MFLIEPFKIQHNKIKDCVSVAYDLRPGLYCKPVENNFQILGFLKKPNVYVLCKLVCLRFTVSNEPIIDFLIGS